MTNIYLFMSKMLYASSDNRYTKEILKKKRLKND